MSYGGADSGESKGNGVEWDEKEQPTMSHDEWLHRSKQNRVPQRKEENNGRTS
jgi:hypothetical protein